MSALGTYTNSADPVQMPHFAVSDQVLHYLLTKISKQNTLKVITFLETPKNYKWTHLNKSNGQRRVKQVFS